MYFETDSQTHLGCHLKVSSWNLSQPKFNSGLASLLEQSTNPNPRAWVLYCNSDSNSPFFNQRRPRRCSRVILLGLKFAWSKAFFIVSLPSLPLLGRGGAAAILHRCETIEVDLRYYYCTNYLMNSARWQEFFCCH